MSWVYFILWLTAVCSVNSQYTWYSSQHGFKKMLQEDLDMLESLQKSVGEIRSNARLPIDWAERQKRKKERLLNQASTAFRHPVSYFKFQQGLYTKDVGIDTSSSIDMTLKRLGFYSWMISIPTKQDKIAVLQSLYSLQKSYNLNTTELSRGIVGDKTVHKMTAEDSYTMAVLAKNDKNWKLALKWIQQASKLYEAGDNRNINGDTLHSFYQDIEKEVAPGKLCAIGSHVASHRPKLKCYMLRNRLYPMLLLEPVKIELLSDNPHIYKFHDVISDNEIDYLKNLSKDKLTNGRTLMDDAWTPIRMENPRIAHHYFIEEIDDPVVYKINKRISYITGLDLSTSEQLQVATYGIGGHYVPHYDAASATTSLSGYNARLATFMFYLSDVQIGGSTVFTRAATAVKPDKGSALFWYNLLPSGELDPMTEHCACPILLGSKWIANKWIRYTDESIREDEMIYL